MALQPPTITQTRQSPPFEIFRQAQDRKLGIENIRSQIALRQAQAGKAQRPEKFSGSDLINTLKFQILSGMTTDQQKQWMLKTGVTVNVGGEGGFDLEQAKSLIAEANKDPNVEVTTTIGPKGPSFSIKPKAGPSASERTAIAETESSLANLENLKTLFDKTTTVTGPIEGRIKPIAGLFGLTTDEQEAFMAATSAFKNAVIKQITGAQMSEQEADRIMKQVPDITDPRVRWLAKYGQTKKNLQTLQKKRLSIIKQAGIKTPTITRPVRPTTPSTKPTGITTDQKVRILRSRGVPEDQIQAALKLEKK